MAKLVTKEQTKWNVTYSLTLSLSLSLTFKLSFSFPVVVISFSTLLEGHCERDEEPSVSLADAVAVGGTDSVLEGLTGWQKGTAKQRASVLVGKELPLLCRDWLQRWCRALKAARHPYTYTSSSCLLFLLKSTLLVSTFEVIHQFPSDAWCTRTHTFKCGCGSSYSAHKRTQAATPPPPPLFPPHTRVHITPLSSPPLTGFTFSPVQHLQYNTALIWGHRSSLPKTVDGGAPPPHPPGTPPLGWHTIMAHRHFSFVFLFYGYFYYKCA